MANYERLARVSVNAFLIGGTLFGAPALLLPAIIQCTAITGIHTPAWLITDTWPTQHRSLILYP